MSDYPRIDVTADVVVLARSHGFDHVLLIQRKNDPFIGHWALPGGYVNVDEDIIDAAVRELKEETSISLDTVALTACGVFDRVDRDPRGRVISHVYYTYYQDNAPMPVAADDAVDAGYLRLESNGKLRRLDMAFDHAKIIEYAFGRYKQDKLI